MFDLIIKNGKVFTGTGNPWYFTDIAIKNGVITEMGRKYDNAKTIINAQGLAVAPGFIDLHDHSD